MHSYRESLSLLAGDLGRGVPIIPHKDREPRERLGDSVVSNKGPASQKIYSTATCRQRKSHGTEHTTAASNEEEREGKKQSFGNEQDS